MFFRPFQKPPFRKQLRRQFNVSSSCPRWGSFGKNALLSFRYCNVTCLVQMELFFKQLETRKMADVLERMINLKQPFAVFLVRKNGGVLVGFCLGSLGQHHGCGATASQHGQGGGATLRRGRVGDGLGPRAMRSF